jgi:hypothetical protein
VNLSLSGYDTAAIVDTAVLGNGGVISTGLDQQLSDAEVSGPTLTVHGAHGGGAMQSRVLNNAVGDGAQSADQLFIISDEFPVPNAQAILGSRFLCQFAVTLDFADSRLGLHDPEAAPGADADWVDVPFENILQSGGVQFEIIVDGHVIPAVLDTGSPFSAMNWAAAGAIGLTPESPGLTEKEFPAHGLLGDAPVKAHLFAAEVAIAEGRLARHDPDLRISDAPVFAQLFQAGPGMLVGLDFLEGRIVRIDWRQGRAWFRE